MSRPRLEDRVGRVELLGRARLEAHRHRFSKLGRDGTGKGNIEAHTHERVWGVVYGLDDEQLEQLEGFEFGYRRVELEVHLDRAQAVAAISFQALSIVEGLAPTRGYLAHYLRGMDEHGVPHDYREAVLRGLEALIG